MLFIRVIRVVQGFIIFKKKIKKVEDIVLNLRDYNSKADIKYKDFMEFSELLKSGDDIDELFLSKRILKIFYGLDLKMIRLLKQQQINILLDKISKVMEMEIKFKNIINYKGIQYGFIPNFSDITAGELIDIEDCYKNNDFISLTSILYRPIIGKIDNLGRYKIEEYKVYNDIFSEVTLDIIEGYISLFTKSFQLLSHDLNISIK